ncbi:MAG: phytanoyl-CoA dioxygenase family protein [Chloroflexota bacterium]
MLTNYQLEEFSSNGVIRLEQFLPLDIVSAVQESILQLAEEEGVWHDGIWQLGEYPNRPRFTKKREVLRPLITDKLLQAVDILVDGQKVKTQGDPGMLFTWPQDGVWTVPTAWHIDLPRQPLPGVPAVQLFTFLAPVPPSCGGTLVVAGSHRLFNNGKYIRSKELIEQLQEYSYFKELMAKEVPNRKRFLTTSGSAEEVDLQVVELHGDPGDTYLVDMRALHTGSTNKANVPRLMVTQRFYLESTMSRSFRGLKSLKKNARNS